MRYLSLGSLSLALFAFAGNPSHAQVVVGGGNVPLAGEDTQVRPADEATYLVQCPASRPYPTGPGYLFPLSPQPVVLQQPPFQPLPTELPRAPDPIVGAPVQAPLIMPQIHQEDKPLPSAEEAILIALQQPGIRL